MILDGPVPFHANGQMLHAAAARHDLSMHRGRFGGPRGLDAAALLEAVARVELTGRGGGHFPVVRKLEPIVASGAATVVINGSEGETLSSKDAALLQLRPHLVLDGAQALARAVRAQQVVVWLHAGADASQHSILEAIRERETDAAHARDVRISVMLGPARYLTGEASAVINGVRGNDVLPAFVLDPAKPWVDGEAVLVHNTETHARIGLLDRIGIDYAPTSLVTIAQHDRRLVIEVEPEVTFAGLFATHGVPVPGALLLGGFGGQWVRWSDIAQLPVDPGRLRRHGVSLGAGIIALVPPHTSGLQWSADILEWMAGESAGQCGPCIFGLPELAKQYRRLVGGRRASARRLGQVRELMALVDQRGACRHPDGAVRMARSALEVFAVGGAR